MSKSLFDILGQPNRPRLLDLAESRTSQAGLQSLHAAAIGDDEKLATISVGEVFQQEKSARKSGGTGRGGEVRRRNLRMYRHTPEALNDFQAILTGRSKREGVPRHVWEQQPWKGAKSTAQVFPDRRV